MMIRRLLVNAKHGPNFTQPLAIYPSLIPEWTIAPRN